MPEADASNVLPKPAPFGLPEADDAAISRASLNDVLSGQTPALATLLSAAVVFVLARLVADPWFHLSLDLMAGILFAVAMFLAVTALLRRVGSTAACATALSLIEEDPTPCVLADSRGRIRARNRAARERAGQGNCIPAALLSHFADAGDSFERVRSRVPGTAAVTDGLLDGQERGSLRAQDLAPDLVLWRLAQTFPNGHDAEAGGVPVLTVDRSGAILSSNSPAERLFGPAPRHLDKLVLDPPIRSGDVHRIAAQGAELRCRVIEARIADGARHIVLLPTSEGIGHLQSDWEAIESLPVPLLRISPAGIILAANRPARSLLRRPIDAETRLSDLLEGLGRPVIEWLADVAAGRPSAGPQVLRGTAGHHDISVRVSLSLAGGPGDPHLIAVLDDVAEVEALEAQVVQSQKMQALGQLAGGVAHDFNNLLTAISGHCDLLLLRHDEGDAEYADLIQIRQNVNRAAALVGQLLAFSRKQSMTPETLDLREVLSDLTHLLNRLVGEKVRLTFDHDPDLRFIRADKRQLEQVIMNLVVNARDAMPEGGAVKIETENRAIEKPVTLGRATMPPGRYVLVKVVDEGVGIPPERLPKIFEPFYTTKRPGEGTGLGLSTAYGIVKQTGGYIFVDSELGKGSTFALWFPAHDRPAVQGTSTPRAVQLRRQAPGTILLVEDEAPVRAFAARALRLHGHQVLEADSAGAALACLEKADAIDLIVTDVILPDLDGPTWVREALSRRPGAKVVFMSGYAEDSFSEQKALIAGSAFLAKPFSLTDLTSLVELQLAAGAPVGA